MLNIIVWTAVAIISWFNPNIDILSKIMFMLAALTIGVQAFIILLLNKRIEENG